MGVLELKCFLAIQVILRLGWVLGNPTVSGGGPPNQCPWDSTCRSIKECTSGYYMTTDMQAFHCGPVRDVESMVCCYNPLQSHLLDNGTGEFETARQNTNDDPQDDGEVEIDVVPEISEVQMDTFQEITEDQDHRHHVEYHEDEGTLEGRKEAAYPQDIHGNPLPLPDLPQDTYESTPGNGQRQESVDRAFGRNPTDSLEREIFEDFNHQESYRLNQPHQGQQFQYHRRFESPNSYLREPLSVQYRIREDDQELHQQYSNEWRRDRYQPKRDYRQNHQGQYKDLNECPCEKGEPGPKGEPGEPGKVVYIPVFVSPSGHPLNNIHENLGSAPSSPFSQSGNGQPHQVYQVGPEFPDNANIPNQAYQYSLPSHPNAPRHVTHPSPTFVPYAVPVPTASIPLPHSSQFGSQASNHPQYRSGPPSGGSQGPNFPQGFPTHSQTSGYSHEIPPVVRQKRYPMH